TRRRGIGAGGGGPDTGRGTREDRIAGRAPRRASAVRSAYAAVRLRLTPMSSAPVRVRGGPGGGDVAAHGVRIVDTPAARVHHPGDLVGVVLAPLATAAVLLLAVYAQGTTTGLASDVQGIGSLVRRILGIPFAVLEGLITLIAPIAVLTELLMRRLVRQAFEAVGAAVVAIVVGLVSVWLMNRYGI